MERTTQLAVNELFGRNDILAEELIKTRKKFKRHKVINAVLFVYLMHTALRHEAEISKLKKENNVEIV